MALPPLPYLAFKFSLKFCFLLNSFFLNLFLCLRSKLYESVLYFHLNKSPTVDSFVRFIHKDFDRIFVYLGNTFDGFDFLQLPLVFFKLFLGLVLLPKFNQPVLHASWFLVYDRGWFITTHHVVEVGGALFKENWLGSGADELLNVLLLLLALGLLLLLLNCLLFHCVKLGHFEKTMARRLAVQDHCWSSHCSPVLPFQMVNVSVNKEYLFVQDLLFGLVIRRFLRMAANQGIWVIGRSWKSLEMISWLRSWRLLLLISRILVHVWVSR